MNRRTFLRTTVIGGGAIGLGACANTATVATDVLTLVNAFEAALKLYPAGTIPAAASAGIATVQSVAAALAQTKATPSNTQGAQIVGAIETALPILATAATAIPVYGPQIALALGAVNVLLPVAAAELGIATASALSPSPAVAALPVVDLATARALYAPR
jgi:hypothetical protein